MISSFACQYPRTDEICVLVVALILSIIGNAVIVLLAISKGRAPDQPSESP